MNAPVRVKIADERLARIFGDPAAAGLKPVNLFDSLESSQAGPGLGRPSPRMGVRKRGILSWLQTAMVALYVANLAALCVALWLDQVRAAECFGLGMLGSCVTMVVCGCLQERLR